MAHKKNEPVLPEPVTIPPEDKPSQAENIISVVLGLAVVLVIGAMIINAIRGRNNPPSPTEEAAKQEQQAANTSEHTVKAGETLWSIAEQYYKDGYKWVEIQKANNLPSGNTVEEGMKLIIPTLAQTPSPTTSAVVTQIVSPSPEQKAEPTKTPDSAEGTKGEALSASTDKQYTVKAGDTLWAIAVATYNNGYKWVDIAKANSLKNPDLIHPGNVFILP